MSTIELTREEESTVTEGAEKAYFETIQEMGRPFDHAELELFISLAIEGAQNSKFIKTYREEHGMVKKSQQHPATGSGSSKRNIKREADKGGVPRRGKLGSLKKGDDTATRNARGIWAQQGGKDATINGDADHRKNNVKKPQ